MIQPNRTFSPFAPPALAGLPMSARSLDGYNYAPHTYVLDIPDVDANATVTGLYMVIDNGSDFFWSGLLVTVKETSAANALMAFRIQLPDGSYFSDDFIGGLGISSFFNPNPFPIVPSIFCPAGSRLIVDAMDQSSISNSATMYFEGMKRY